MSTAYFIVIEKFSYFHVRFGPVLSCSNFRVSFSDSVDNNIVLHIAILGAKRIKLGRNFSMNSRDMSETVMLNVLGNALHLE